MIISHNLKAMNAQRQFNIVGDSKKKSTEKLSSGYRINRAADDSAGLAISEKMRRQIRGLTQGAYNIQDGISLVQVADGALNETQDILQRMNELAVKSANGTNTIEDRKYINNEVQQLKKEIDRIANNTSFNDKIFPILSSDNIQSHVAISNLMSLDAPMNPIGIFGQVFNGKTLKFDRFESDNGIIYGVFPTESLTIYDRRPYETRFYLSMKDASGKTIEEKIEEGDPIGSYTCTSGPNVSASYGLIKSLKYSCNIEFSQFTIDDLKDFVSQLEISFDEEGYTKFSTNSMNIETREDKNIWIQSGSEVGVGFNLHTVDATAGALGLVGIDVSSENTANDAIEKVKGALAKVSGYRTYFGSMQNRMEHAYNSNMNVVENTQAAESRIRDTDMAKEMVSNSIMNIIEQAGISMIAQANQTNQGVMTLL